MNNKEIITPEFKLFRAPNPNGGEPVLIIGMLGVEEDDQHMIQSYLRKKEYSLLIDKQVMMLSFFDEVYVFDFTERNVDLPDNGFTVVFDFVNNKGSFDNTVKTLVNVMK